VVFFVQNNKYAISVPLARQSVAPSLAAKAIGYGMPGFRVDGNDLPALEKVLGEAVARARAGEGPTLVEADTYRIESHTNADDASRYRTDDEVSDWLPRDPLLRVRTYLRKAGALDDALEQKITAAAEEMAAAVRAGVGADTPVDPEDLFAHVYSTPTPQLAEQRATLRAELDLEEA
jgi:pyruvate dehydrogenase E1 component alpha subunit